MSSVNCPNSAKKQKTEHPNEEQNRMRNPFPCGSIPGNTTVPSFINDVKVEIPGKQLFEKSPMCLLPNRQTPTSTKPPSFYVQLWSSPGRSKSTTVTITNDNSSQSKNDATPSQKTDDDEALLILKERRVIWQGFLLLKKSQARIQLHMLSGNVRLAKACLPPMIYNESPAIRISQRMRLIPPALLCIEQKMEQKDEHCILLAFPVAHNKDKLIVETNHMKHKFLEYLRQKMAAGIICIAKSEKEECRYIIYVFPQGDFAKKTLARVAPKLLNLHNSVHFIVVITTNP